MLETPAAKENTGRVWLNSLTSPKWISITAARSAVIPHASSFLLPLSASSHFCCCYCCCCMPLIISQSTLTFTDPRFAAAVSVYPHHSVYRTLHLLFLCHN